MICAKTRQRKKLCKAERETMVYNIDKEVWRARKKRRKERTCPSICQIQYLNV